MGITAKDFQALQGGVNEMYKADAEARQSKLADFLQRKRQQDNLEAAKGLVNDKTMAPGRKLNVRVGDVDLSEAQAIPNLRAFLTPAQESAEKEAGKKISDFEGGGRQTQESNIGQMQNVQDQLQGGKRDLYDRIVGGFTENHPTIQGLVAPTEKARRDQVQNAMLGMLHEAGIPRPTQWDIQRVFGQVYDPSAPDETNLARLQTAVSKMQSQKSAAEAQAAQYHKTGYATLGGSAPAAPKIPQQLSPLSPAKALSPEEQLELDQLRKELGK